VTAIPSKRRKKDLSSDDSN